LSFITGEGVAVGLVNLEPLVYFVFGAFVLLVGAPLVLLVVRWLNQRWLDPPLASAPRDPPEGSRRGEYFPPPPADWRARPKQASHDPDTSFRPADCPTKQGRARSPVMLQ
jgi:hypothetical protein